MKLRLGAKIDKLYKKKQKISEMEKKVKDLKAEAKKLEEEIIDTLDTNNSTLHGGLVAKGKVIKKNVPTIKAENWPKLQEWMLENKDFAVLQRRLGTRHIKELWDEGVEIPGVETYLDIKLSLTKV